MPRLHRTIGAIAISVPLLLLLPSGGPSAHEVPSELTVALFVKPDQDTLHVLVRVPLSGLMGTGMPKEGIGYLSLATIGPSLERTAVQIAQALEIDEDGQRLGPPRIVTARISLPFDTSFASYDEAEALLAGPPLPVDTQVYWLQGNFDARFDYPIRSDRASFSVHANLARLAPQVTTSLRFLAPNQPVRFFEYLGDPGRVWLNPRWYQVVPMFGRSGFLDAIRAADLWLFALCLLIPWRRGQNLLRAIGVFAAAFAATGLIVTYGPDTTGAWLPPLLAAAIAALLVYAALENIVSGRRTRRWQTALAFGVIAGLSFSITLRPLAQFAAGHVLSSVLSFNLGATLGALTALAFVALTLAVLYRFFARERLRTIVLSALVANVAWTWFFSRATQLSLVQWPLPTARNMVTATSWMLVVVVAAGCLWVLSGLRAHKARAEKQPLTREAGR